MFELELLLANLVAPMAIMLCCFLAVRFCSSTARLRVAPVLFGLSGTFAIWLSFSLKNGFLFWPDDAWQKIPIATLLVATVAVAIQWLPTQPTSVELDSETSSAISDKVMHTVWAITFLQMAMVSAATLMATWLIFPRGDSWAELQGQRTIWLAVITLGVSLAWFGFSCCYPSDNHTRSSTAITAGFALIAVFIAGAFLTAQSFMKVTELMIAVATVLGTCCIAEGWLTHCRVLPSIVPPLVFAAAAIEAHGRFYCDIPATIYVLAILSPAIIAFITSLVLRKSPKLAMAVSICLAAGLAATIICATLYFAPSEAW